MTKENKKRGKKLKIIGEKKGGGGRKAKRENYDKTGNKISI